jgi:cysteine-rich repeat protein
MRVLVATWFLAALCGCIDDPTSSDGGSLDGGTPDGGSPDGGRPDGGRPDARVCEPTECTVAGSRCIGDSLSGCAPDADGCLVETITPCAEGARCVLDTCVEGCPGAHSTAIVCGVDVIIPANVADGTSSIDDYSPCAGDLDYGGSERVFHFANESALGREVIISAAPGSASQPFGLFLLEGGPACGVAGSCLAAGDRRSGVDFINFFAEAETAYFIVYDGPEDSGSFVLEVSCEPIPECGDGYTIADEEECDDGNLVSGDGCSADCTVEPGYYCEALPSLCVMICGDADIDDWAGEECDDGNYAPGDGCSAYCRVEPGYTCTDDEPSVCTPR